MRLHLEEYRDKCGDINCTKLAEDACDSFNLYEDDDDATIPEWIFDCAVDVAEGKR